MPAVDNNLTAIFLAFLLFFLAAMHKTRVGCMVVNSVGVYYYLLLENGKEMERKECHRGMERSVPARNEPTDSKFSLLESSSCQCRRSDSSRCLSATVQGKTKQSRKYTEAKDVLIFYLGRWWSVVQQDSTLKTH